MDLYERLSAFYQKARADNRITATHISLYFSLLHALNNQANNSVIHLQRSLIMDSAKISSRVTYNKCMRELHEYGYINYRPSFIAGRSTVSLIILL
jgi:hypothetical protein